jgi:hypothetical protein
MGICFDVQVLDSDGNPVAGKHVHASFPGVIGAGWLKELTDDNGHAIFETTSHDHGKVNINVGGKSFGPYELDDGAAYTVTLG